MRKLPEGEDIVPQDGGEKDFGDEKLVKSASEWSEKTEDWVNHQDVWRKYQK